RRLGYGQYSRVDQVDEEFARARNGVDQMNKPQSHRDTKEERERVWRAKSNDMNWLSVLHRRGAENAEEARGECQKALYPHSSSPRSLRVLRVSAVSSALHF